MQQMPSIPDSVSATAVADAFASLGIDVKDLRRAVMTPVRLELEFRARNEDGQVFAAGKEIATVTVVVPIERGV